MIYSFRSALWILEELRFKVFKRKLDKSDLEILERKFSFFSRLSNRHKREFCEKLEMILTTKEFIGRGGIHIVSQEMEILIGATIVMVTFGWKKIRLPHFKRILVYPNAYYSTISKTYHRGEVNPKLGIIVVSWNCFLDGFSDDHDGVNLGVHEIAHALQLENLIKSNAENNFLDPVAFKEYSVLAKQELKKLISNSTTFFRKAGGINEHEFFAVALENFFERPHEFFDYNPMLYATIVRLLRQDPRVWIKEQG
ncbi:zinc-dependent peptidase [Algoriphagus sp.]|uniref:zinc-dependent peptidase n=1 Tax=Algoriphagus sp. TaxID=1872435 RepID=UPI0025E50C06|nr:zinc-dependent peptidase [Algoriphagus sp.]